CGPCKMISPIFDELAEEYEGRIIAGKVNVDDNDETCAAYGIMNIPTILFFKGGELVHRQVGAIRKPDLQKLFEELL
ncbi:MAG: thiol reductase thioredoxin, partial [Paludibacteraceae bacterium]|nr:thiol reductase thioredoxin [Paludibacteraceae bacterium]